MKKTDIINYLADGKGYTTYLEVVSQTTGNEYASLDRKRFCVAERLILRYAFDLLSDRGTIVVHDCNPPDPELASPMRTPGSYAWCGLTPLA